MNVIWNQQNKKTQNHQFTLSLTRFQTNLKEINSSIVSINSPPYFYDEEKFKTTRPFLFNALWSSGRVGNEVLCCKLLILLTRLTWILKTTCFPMVSRCHVKERLTGGADQNKEPRLLAWPGSPYTWFQQPPAERTKNETSNTGVFKNFENGNRWALSYPTKLQS